jgi:hypothetical protein
MDRWMEPRSWLFKANKSVVAPDVASLIAERVRQAAPACEGPTSLDPVPIYEFPSPESAVLATVAAGARVTVFAEDGEYVAVVTADYEFGFVRRVNNVRFEPTPSTPMPQPPG